LRSVLDSLSGSLFTIDADGTVTALDGAGRDALSRDGATLAPRIVSVARGGADDRLVRIRGDSTTAYVMLVSPEDAFEGRIARCAEAWQLTPRQIEVVSMAVRGLANKEIAAQLGCAPHTIELHMSEALRRAKVDGRAALVAAFWSGAALPAAKRPGVE
jgi:DNA-binding NarL/FixJ family response regulator